MVFSSIIINSGHFQGCVIVNCINFSHTRNRIDKIMIKSALKASYYFWFNVITRLQTPIIMMLMSTISSMPLQVLNDTTSLTPMYTIVLATGHILEQINIWIRSSFKHNKTITKVWDILNWSIAFPDASMHVEYFVDIISDTHDQS